MTKLMQRWQLTYQEERSLAQECDMCQQYGFTGILAKAMDGPVFMGAYDNNHDAISSPDDVARQTAYCHSRGLAFHVWFNPLTNRIEEQAMFMAECINNSDGGWFDTEPYAQFWGAWRPAGLARQLMEGVLQQLTKETILVWQPDPRPTHLAELRPEEWYPYMTHYAPQDYVSDFYLQPTASLYWSLLNATLATAAQYNLHPWTTVPGNAAQYLVPADALQRFDGFAVWRIGSTPADMLSYLGGLVLAGQSEEPVADCSAIEADRDKYDLFFRDLANRVVIDKLTAELHRTTASGKPAAPRKKVLEAIVAETQHQYNQAYDITQLRNQALVQAATPVPAPSAETRRGAYGNIAEGAR